MTCHFAAFWQIFFFVCRMMSYIYTRLWRPWFPQTKPTPSLQCGRHMHIAQRERRRRLSVDGDPNKKWPDRQRRLDVWASESPLVGWNYGGSSRADERAILCSFSATVPPTLNFSNSILPPNSSISTWLLKLNDIIQHPSHLFRPLLFNWGFQLPYKDACLWGVSTINIALKGNKIGNLDK